MKNSAFCELADEFHTHLRLAADQFMKSHGIKPSWNTFWQNTTTDHEQNVRELLFFAGDVWVEHDEPVDA